MARISNKFEAARIAAVKAAAKAELDGVEAETGRASRLTHALRKVRLLESPRDPSEALALHVWIMSALVHHERRGGLKRRQVEQLADLDLAALRVHSAPRMLLGELHLVLSQIERRAGRHWAAFWEQQTAATVARGDGLSDGLAALGVGIRAQRLAHSDAALAALTDAEAAPLPEAQRELARINRIRGLRLAGRLDDCEALVAETAQWAEASASLKREVEWEEMCLAVQRDHNVARLVAAVGRRGEHGQAVFIVEAFLWAHAVGNLQWLARLPKMTTLARRVDLKPRRLGFLFRAALAIEALFDEDVPVERRVRAVGELVANVHKLLGVDRELLLLLAVTRWLVRVRALTLAAATLREYQHLSLKLTDGGSADVLALAGDLVRRPWYKRSAGAA